MVQPGSPHFSPTWFPSLLQYLHQPFSGRVCSYFSRHSSSPLPRAHPCKGPVQIASWSSSRSHTRLCSWWSSPALTLPCRHYSTLQKVVLQEVGVFPHHQEHINLVTFQLEHRPHFVIHNVFHASLLAPHHPSIIPRRNFPPPPPIELSIGEE